MGFSSIILYPITEYTIYYYICFLTYISTIINLKRCNMLWHKRVI